MYLWKPDHRSKICAFKNSSISVFDTNIS